MIFDRFVGQLLRMGLGWIIRMPFCIGWEWDGNDASESGDGHGAVF